MQLGSNTRLGLANSNPTFSVLDPKSNYQKYSLTGEDVPIEVWETKLPFRGCHQVLEAIVEACIINRISPEPD